MSTDLRSHDKALDTGKAALLAYTNLDHLPQSDDSMGDPWRKSPNTRNGMHV